MSVLRPAVLLVDDDDLTRDLLARFLEKNGFATAGAADGDAAIERVTAGGLDAVLLDVLMEGRDGFDVLEDLRRRHSATELPVLMATAQDDSVDIIRALSLGANDYVTKPFDFPVVLARLRTHLALKVSVDRIRALEQQLTRRNEELTEANHRMRRDLVTAARVQAALLPGAAPESSAARFAWEFRPCDELAGDLLNILPLDDGQVAVYVLDVAGHGAAAALLAVMVSRVLNQLRLGGGLARPTEVAAHLNREFPYDARTEQYFTLLYGVLGASDDAFRFVAAGHPGPIHLPRDGPARGLKLPGSPIGLAADAYEEHALTLRPGDRLYLYSDGLPEAKGGATQAFGERRLLDLLEETRAAPLADGLGRVVRAARAWCGDVPPQDDITLLAIERT